MLYTKVRGEPQFLTNNIFHGETSWTRITPNGAADFARIVGDLYTDKVLYNFEFVNSGTPPALDVDISEISQYFGIMDIDMVDAKKPGVDFEKLKKDYLDLLKTQLDAMGFDAYRIYFSGSKGYHVYIYDIKLWRKPSIVLDSNDRLNWINQQLELMFPTLVDHLDPSIYRINSGIRSFTYPHPTKRTLNVVVFETDNAPVCHWTWILDNFNGKTPILSPYTTQTTTRIQTRPTTRINTRVTVIDDGDSLLSKARAIFKVNNVLPSLLDKGKRGNAKLYVVDTKYCPIKGGEHKDKMKCYILDKTNSEKIVKIKCHKASCSTSDILIKPKYEPLTAIYPTIQDMVNTAEISSSPKRVRIIPSTQKYVSSDDIAFCLEDGYGLVSAPMGTGKTTALKTWISQIPQPLKILLIVVRRTQAANFTGVYDGMVNYLEVEGSLYNLQSTVVCLNSLQRVRENGTGAIPHYDLLILDEIETLIEGLINPQLSCSKSKQCDIWRLFKVLIYSSRNVLFMDGILTDSTIRFLDEIKILSDCTLVEHRTQPDCRTYENFTDITAFEERLTQDIERKQKVCLVSNTKSSLLLFEDKTRILGVTDRLAITGDSTDGDKMTSSDPNNLWEREVLAFNTAVGPGASFDRLYYDIMYVLISPVSCSPYWMYQMINRIRTLSRSLVRVFMCWNEEKNIPTLDEYKIKRAQNIIDMNWNQTKFPIPLAYFTTGSADNFMLEINPENRSIIRKMVEENKLVLRHEDDHFLNTLARYEHRKLKNNNTQTYSNLFYDIIRRNGGIVRREINYNEEETVEHIKISSLMLKKNSLEFYKNSGKDIVNSLSERLNPYRADRAFITAINQVVQLNDIDTHLNWRAFRGAIRKSDQDLYLKELESINDRSKAVNNTLLFSNGIIESFKDICEILGLRINYALGLVDGEIEVDRLFDNHRRVNDLVETIKKCLYSKKKVTGTNYNTYKETLSLSKKNTAVYRNLKYAFRCLGIEVEKKGGKNYKTFKQSKERYAAWSIVVPLYPQQVRLALDGLAYDTGLPIDNSIEHLKQMPRQ